MAETMNLENQIRLINDYSRITGYVETDNILVTGNAYRAVRDDIRQYLLDNYEICLNDDKLTTDTADFVEIKLTSDTGILQSVDAYGCQLVDNITIS